MKLFKKLTEEMNVIKLKSEPISEEETSSIEKKVIYENLVSNAVSNVKTAK